MSVIMNNVAGIVCGRRKDDSRCVLWDNDTFEWFTAEEFANKFGN